ncbi:MAG: alpha/beta fold hydrolase [Deltaproteobacteria bacterium]|nr:alpha/beta fold hydrolase [Deltaproteobacteria bacterium]
MPAVPPAAALAMPDMVGEAREASVEGIAVAWSELGSGPALVLLHGIHDSHRTWRRIAPVLAQWFRVLMPDLPGHGLSSRPDAPYTLTWYSRIVSAWMDAIGVATAHLCGHSLGGGIAQWMVLQERHRIDRLALVSPGGLGREVGLGMKYAAIPYIGPALTPLVVRWGFPLTRWLAPRTFGFMERDEAARLVADFRVPGTDRAFRRSLESVINLRGQHVRTSDRAGEIEALPPIALFWGEKDPILPVRHGRAAVRGSTGITLTTYPSCGHFPQLEIPAKLARDIREFLLDPQRPVACITPRRPAGR